MVEGSSCEWFHVERKSVKWVDLVSVFVNNLNEATMASQLSFAFSFVGPKSG